MCFLPMQEEWKDVPEYEGRYRVSNYGRAFSVERFVGTIGGGQRKVRGRMLKTARTTGGYLFYSLNKVGIKPKTISAHALVLWAFVGPRPHLIEGMAEIDHVDSNILNNHLYNLRYISHRENISISRKGKTSKYTGVHKYRDNIRWVAVITINKKKTHLGLFCDEKEASDTYQKALSQHLLSCQPT